MQAIKKVLDVINKTGDRCIIVSEESEEAYAIMSLKEYERIMFGKAQVADLTEDELLDRINRDIAIWKSQQQEAPDSRDFEPDFTSELEDSGENLANDRANEPKSDSFSVRDEKEDFEGFEEEEPYYFERA